MNVRRRPVVHAEGFWADLLNLLVLAPVYRSPMVEETKPVNRLARMSRTAYTALLLALVCVAVFVGAGIATAAPNPNRDVTVVDHGRTPQQNLAAYDYCMTTGGHALISYDPASQTLVCEP